MFVEVAPTAPGRRLAATALGLLVGAALPLMPLCPSRDRIAEPPAVRTWVTPSGFYSSMSCFRIVEVWEFSEGQSAFPPARALPWGVRKGYDIYDLEEYDRIRTAHAGALAAGTIERLAMAVRGDCLGTDAGGVAVPVLVDAKTGAVGSEKR